MLTWCLSFREAEWCGANIHSRSMGISHEDLCQAMWTDNLGSVLFSVSLQKAETIRMHCWQKRASRRYLPLISCHTVLWKLSSALRTARANFALWMLLSIRAVSHISNSCHSFLTELSPSEGEQVLFLALLRGLASAVSHCHRRTMAMLQAAHSPQTPDGGDLGINDRAHT